MSSLVPNPSGTRLIAKPECRWRFFSNEADYWTNAGDLAAFKWSGWQQIRQTSPALYEVSFRLTLFGSMRLNHRIHTLFGAFGVRPGFVSWLRVRKKMPRQ